MEDALGRGVPPDRIAFVTFTRAAAGEALARAQERFGFHERELPHFRTLHSLAFRELGVRRSDVLAEEHLGELADLTGELLTNPAPVAEGPATRRSADELLTVDHYARTTLQDLRAAWNDHGGDLDWFRLKRFSDAYALYKSDRSLVDFTDMLTLYSDGDLPPVAVDVAIVDEAQDLTLAQWRVAERAFRSSKEIWAGGDDDQSVHKWAGAAENHLLGLDWPQEVLPLSHRLPMEVFDLAAQVIGQVGRRFAKPWGSSGRPGLVQWVSGPEEVDLRRGSWLLLARTRSQLQALAQVARDQGVTYRVKGAPSVDPAHARAVVAYERLRAGKRVEGAEAAVALRHCGLRGEVDESRTYTAAELRLDARPIWHDALVRIPAETREYYLACLRRGESLTKPPRVRVDTIHGAKGAEADHVLLQLDLTWQTFRGLEIDPDSEHKVWYVGVTRARETLTLVEARTAYRYPMV